MSIFKRRKEDIMNHENDNEGRSAESDNYLDNVQDSVQKGDSNAMDLKRADVDPQPEVQVDESVLNAESGDVVNREPEQVQSDIVVYVPRKDFEGSVNRDPYDFKKGVPVEITRDVANMLLEDEDRGYVRD